MKPRIALVAALAAAPCFAADERPTELEPVVVTATRSEQSGNRLPAAMTVITREQIERSGARHVVDALRLAGAVQISDFYGDGSRATVDLRGFGDSAHSTTLVLVDGRRLNNTDIGPPDLNSISLKDVERIEIIQGSAGVLYGDQAIGGVVNIVTRAPLDEATLQAGAGSYDALSGRGAIARRGQHFSARLSAEVRGTDNYREHNAQEYKNAQARIGWETPAAAVFVEGGYVMEDLETPGPLFASEVKQDRRQSTANFRNDFSDTNTGFVRVNWLQHLSDSWDLVTDFTHRRSNGGFRLSFASGFSSPGEQDRDLRSMNPRLSGSLPWFGRRALITFGADGLIVRYRLNSTAFGEQKNRQKQGDVYAQTILPLPAQLEATAGARVAHLENKVEDAFAFPGGAESRDTQTAGELGLAWRPWDALRLFTRYDRDFRFGKVEEITNACSAGTINLATQTGDSWEAGAELSAGPARLGASAYRLRQRNEIAFDPSACGGFGASINLDATRRDGFLLQGSAAIAQRVWLDGSLHHLNSRIAGGGLSGKRIPLVARDNGKLGVSAELPAGFSAHVETQAISGRPFAGDFGNTLGRLPGFAVLNGAAAWQHRGWRAEARVDNLLDREYSEYGAAAFDALFTESEAFFPSPKRRFGLTVGYTW